MTLPAGDFTTIPGISRVSDAVLEEQLVENLIAFFNWALLGIGAFYNVRRPSPKSVFQIADTPNYVTGTVWESTKSNWVYETSIAFATQPISVSVYVNNTLTTTGFYINYIDGQIVFDNPLAATTVVEAEYSYRRFNFYPADSDWFHQVVFDPLPDADLRNTLAKNRVYLPAIIVEVVGDTTLTPLQLGDLSVWEDQVVLFHILTDQAEDRDKLLYIFKRMYQKTIWLYDTNKVADANAYPTTIEGSVVSSPLMYPDLINEFAWKRCIFFNIRPQDVTLQLPLFRAVVRTSLRIQMP